MSDTDTDADPDDGTPPTFASPPCFLHEVDPAYSGVWAHASDMPSSGDAKPRTNVSSPHEKTTEESRQTLNTANKRP